MKFDIITFTTRGAVLAERLLRLYPGSRATVPQRYCRGLLQPLENIHDWTRVCFQTDRMLVYIGAAGVAVRAIAPFVKDKATDAAIICIDERGENIIPLLSGHIGGANRAAKKIAKALGGRAIITTATDLNGIFAVDDWAARNNCLIADTSAIKYISVALLDGQTVGFRSDFPIEGILPVGMSSEIVTENGIEIALKYTAPFPRTLHIIPRVIVAGIGCRRCVPADLLEKRLLEALAQANVPIEAVDIISTIDIKANETGLIELCNKLNVTFLTWPAEGLMAAQGEFVSSERVMCITGADNVCERAVVRAGARLIMGKNAAEGVTIALGILDWTVKFEEGLD